MFPPKGAHIRVQATGRTTIHGYVTSHGTKDGRPILNYRDTMGNDRWCYLPDVLNVNGDPPPVTWMGQ